MKQLFLLVILSSSVAVSANDRVETDTIRNLASGSLLANAKGPFRLPNGNGLYLLPESNMPCVVPSLQNYNMPNLATKKSLPSPQAPGTIPQVKPVPPIREAILKYRKQEVMVKKTGFKPQAKSKIGLRLTY